MFVGNMTWKRAVWGVGRERETYGQAGQRDINRDTERVNNKSKQEKETDRQADRQTETKS